LTIGKPSSSLMIDELSMPKLGQTLKRLNMILILPNCPCTGFSNSFVCTYNVFVKSIDGKSQQGQAFKISNLLQLHFEETSFVQA
jgi:hypothetical protein